jgi:MFS family permease
MRVAITVTPFLLPLMLQIGFGMDAFTSGLLTLIYFAGNLAMKVVTTPILHRFAFRPVLLTSGMLIAASMVGCALLQPDTPLLVTAAILFGGGLVRSMAFTSLNTLAFADIPQRLMSGATVLTSILFQITLGLGVALGALLLNLAVVLRGGSTLAPDLVDFHVAFLGGAALALVAALGMLQLERHAGAAIRTARKSA